MKKKNPIEEARRYVDNAKKTLKENGELNPQTNRYEDPKYVRAAGNYLWHGVLIALDAVFNVRNDKRTRVNINAYEEAVSKRDIKLLGWVTDGYQIMHLYMNYDGIQSKKVCDNGFQIANRIIDRCEKMIA
ncbi:MAG: DUF5618 family protein [Bacteroidales bacterium]|nr:DUF5618 family protein [Bacteroidales bacterium]